MHLLGSRVSPGSCLPQQHHQAHACLAAAPPRTLARRQQPPSPRLLPSTRCPQSYEEYCERFRQLREIQGGVSSSPAALAAEGGKAGGATGAEGGGKENGAGEGGADVGGAAGAGAPNPQHMIEEDYVAYCQR